MHSSKGGMSRPQTATERQESEMASKNLHELEEGSADMDPIQRLRTLCLSRGANGILAVGRIFRRMIEEGNHKLNRKEFLLGLRKAGLEVSEEEADMIFDQFNKDGSGHIHLTEFLAYIRPPMSESRKTVVDEAFRKMDVTRDKSYITTAQLRKCYNVKSQPLYISGEESEEKMVTSFLANFVNDATRDGHVTHEEFFNYYSAISASIDDDCYFDLMMRQAYKL